MGNLLTKYNCCEAGHNDGNEIDYETIKQKQYRRVFMRSKTYVADLKKKYVQGKTLGEGSFGKVVKCTNVQANTQVAMKIVNKKKIMSTPVFA